MAKRDYYDVLGVSRTATQDEIRKAHRRLVRQYHPDANKDNPAATEKFKEVQEAYEVLSDPDKRKKYDQFGHAGVSGDVPPNAADPFEAFRRARAGSGSGGWRTTRATVDFGGQGFNIPGGFETIFEELFGGRRSPGPGTRAGFDPFGPEVEATEPHADVEHTVELTFEQAALGARIPVTLQVDGSSELLEIKVPPGVTDGTRVRVRGKGRPGVHGRGDLFITYRVLPHPVFRREGFDVFCNVDVPVYDALLGGKVSVPTLDGEVTVTVPPGTPSGTKLRIRGKGIPHDSTRGDHYAVVRILVPRDLSPRARQLVEELRSIAPVEKR
ncbi:MAG: DnaJ C-terminal domain-containing protein [Tepidisphaerales bacterium]